MSKSGLKSSLKNLNVGWSNLERESVVLLCKHLPCTIEKLNLSGCKTTLLDSDIHNLGQDFKPIRMTRCIIVNIYIFIYLF